MNTETIQIPVTDTLMNGKWGAGNAGKHPAPYLNQNGATLFTALIFLIMLSLLGLNAAQMSGLEEKMAGNARNRDLAFQAAEAALNFAAQNLTTYSTQVAQPGGTNPGALPAGLRQFNNCLPNTVGYWNGNGANDCSGTSQSFSWVSTTTITPTFTLQKVDSQPRFVVDRLSDVGATQRYRVTARGVGGDSNAVVILQAMFTLS